MKLSFFRFAKILFLLISFLAFVLLQQSCKKTELISEESVDKYAVTQKFFSATEIANPIVNRVINYIKNKNLKNEFVVDFAIKNGYPIWDKTQIRIYDRTTGGSSFTSNNDSIVLIPLVLENQKTVNGFIKAKLKPNDSLSLTYSLACDYKNYPFKNPNNKDYSAEAYSVLMMTLDNAVFGYTKFNVNDTLLFHQGNNTANSQMTVSLLNQESQNPTVAQGVVVTETCTNTTVSIGWHGSGCNDFQGNSIVSGCLIQIQYNSCYITGIDWGDEGTGIPGGGIPTGGGGGGGGGPIIPYAYPCIPGPQSVNGSNLVPGGPLPPCPPPAGGTGVIPLPLTDSHGYYYTRIAQLDSMLQANPFALEPCDSLTLMDFTTYGSMYQNVAQFTPPQYVKDRIDSIRGVANNWFVDNFYLTNVDNANGTVVNCDFFPVRITQLPPGATPAALLEYFRKNINLFIDSSLDVNFSAYNDLAGFSDTLRYNANDTNSTGALIHIDMDNDGSVIQSGYFHNNNNQNHQFTFTTMATPLDLSHPVAGNRVFGIYKSTDPLHPNDYVFYTMGVDRTNDWVMDVGNYVFNGFGKADALWKSVQKNMINFINDPLNGGHAEYYSRPQIIARPKWDSVKEFLFKQIDLATLKIRLGC
jgi:hypothetical protein